MRTEPILYLGQEGFQFIFNEFSDKIFINHNLHLNMYPYYLVKG